MTFDTDELERRIIGSLVRDPTLIDRVDRLRYDDIQDTVCRDIFSALRGLAKSKTPVSLDTIAGSCIGATGDQIHALKERGTLSVDRLHEAVEMLIDQRRSHMLKGDLQEALGKLNNGHPWRSVIADINTKVVSGYDSYRARHGEDVRSAVVRNRRKGATTRVPTGIASVDSHFGGGLPPTYLIGLGAQTKTGKTAFVATVSGNLDNADIPHAVFSLERNETHIESLKLSRKLGIHIDKLDDHLDRVEAMTDRSSTYYVHDTNLTVEDWRHDVLFHVRRHGIRLVLVDYWQLFAPSSKQRRSETRENELNRTVQVIANTAVDAGIPIVLMSQNNESGDPKDCKAIKQAAGYYGVIHRDQDQDAAWIETIATSVSPLLNIGSHSQPALSLDLGVGPYFQTVP